MDTYLDRSEYPSVILVGVIGTLLMREYLYTDYIHM